LTFERDGEYVLLRYRESASVPCYRHVIVETLILDRLPPLIDVKLRLEPTSDICVECIGVIETTLRVGPVASRAEISVNNLRITV